MRRDMSGRKLVHMEIRCHKPMIICMSSSIRYLSGSASGANSECQVEYLGNTGLWPFLTCA
jgi:hypothetical protein